MPARRPKRIYKQLEFEGGGWGRQTSPDPIEGAWDEEFNNILTNIENKENNMTQAELLSEMTGQEPIKPEATQYNETYKGTPIWIRGNETHGYFATLGDHKITENKTYIKQVEEELNEKSYNLLMNIMIIMFNSIKTVDKMAQDELNNI